MKINNLNLGRISQTKGEIKPTSRVQRTQQVTQDQVSISEEARFLSELREAAGSMGEIRANMVEEASQDIAEGRLGTEEDYRRAIDAMMMEL
jgi:anti-sigma28 factor (negative regulator of flagellin synthesis)